MGANALVPATALVGPAMMAIGLTLLSGLGDAYGFVNAARIWRDDLIQWPALGRSALGFLLGISMQWTAIRYLQRVGVTVAELQTMVWFAVTIIGVGLLSRGALEWAVSERVIALGVLCGLGWLVVHTGG